MTTPETMNQSTKRGRPGYDQDSVLKIAVEVFNLHGYEATSMGKLADRLGISKSAIYHHVPSKGELLRLALDEALIPLEALVQHHSDAQSADERLEYFLRSTIEILLAKRPYVTLLLRLRGNTDIEREALKRRRAVDGKLAELVSRAQAEGSVREDLDAKTTARLLFGMINSLVDWYREDGPIDTRQIEDHAITVVFQGLHAGK